MNALRSKDGYAGSLRLLLTILTLAVATVAIRAETLLTCAGMPGGDRYDRGFYIPSYPGNSLDSARLEFSSADVGNYTVTMTVRSNAYDGVMLGTSSTTFALAGAYPQNKPVTFNFPSARITEGRRVCFILTLNASPAGNLFYSVADFVSGCTLVMAALPAARANSSLIVFPASKASASAERRTTGDAAPMVITALRQTFPSISSTTPASAIAQSKLSFSPYF